MKRILSFLLLFLSVAVLRAQDFAFSERMLGHLLAGRGDSIRACMNAEMQAALPASALDATMARLVLQVGAYRQHGAWERTRNEGADVDRCRLVFERADLQLTLATDAAGRLSGLWLAPLAKENTVSSAVDERPVRVVTGRVSLPGIFCLPARREGKVPVVVLVHGSGPNDRDETLGPNKPFRELARRLAEAGIASLRYDKRTYVYGAATAEVSGGTLDYDAETVDDAVAALNVAAVQPEADFSRLYVLGHSLGGLLVPRIAARSMMPLAGMISWAGGPMRGMEETLRRQADYVVRLQGGTAEEADSMARKLLAALPESYLRAASRYDVEAEARRTQTPFLLLQGGHDYQVTADDFSLWRTRLAGRGAVQFVWLDRCDHLLRELPRMAVPEDYLRPGEMAPGAVQAIVRFVREGIPAAD